MVFTKNLLWTVFLFLLMIKTMKVTVPITVRKSNQIRTITQSANCFGTAFMVGGNVVDPFLEISPVRNLNVKSRLQTRRKYIHDTHNLTGSSTDCNGHTGR